MGVDKENQRKLQGVTMRDWHIDRNVSLGIILTLILHFGGTIWFFSDLNGRVEENSKALAKIESLSEKVAMHDQFIQRNKGVATQVAVIDERTKHIVSAVDEIKTQLQTTKQK